MLDRLVTIAAGFLAGSLAGLGVPGTACGQGVRGGADSVSVRALAPGSAVPAGARLTIDVAFRHAAGFHSWPNEPVVPPEFAGVNPIATTIEVVSLPQGAELEAIDWPEPVPVTVRYTRRAVELLSYVDTAVAHVRIRLSPDQPSGTIRVELRVRYQSCDSRVCYPPRTKTLSVPLEVSGPPGVRATPPACLSAPRRAN